MHAAHARNSDQEFLELELYHDFSRCNPNSHEICMSQIARYVDDRINGGSFSSHLRYWEAGKRGDPEARERDRGATARGCINVFTRYSRVSSSSRQRVSRSYCILSSSFHVPPILFPIFQRSTLFTPRAPIPFASFYLSERFRARWFTAAITHGRERRRWPESIERAAAARRRLEEIVDAANVRSSSVSTPTRFTSDVITQTQHERLAGSTGMPCLPIGSLLVFSSSQSIYAGSRLSIRHSFFSRRVHVRRPFLEFSNEKHGEIVARWDGAGESSFSPIFSAVWKLKRKFLPSRHVSQSPNAFPSCGYNFDEKPCRRVESMRPLFPFFFSFFTSETSEADSTSEYYACYGSSYLVGVCVCVRVCMCRVHENEIYERMCAWH